IDFMISAVPNPRPEISDDVRRFIATNVPSVPYLEALLLLRAEAPKAWDARSLAGRLYVREAEAARLLAELSEAGVADGEAEAYRFAPKSDELRVMIEGLADAYAHDLLGVSSLIHSRTDRRA